MWDMDSAAHVARDRDGWRAVMDVWVSVKCGVFPG